MFSEKKLTYSRNQTAGRLLSSVRAAADRFNSHCKETACNWSATCLPLSPPPVLPPFSPNALQTMLQIDGVPSISSYPTTASEKAILLINIHLP